MENELLKLEIKEELGNEGCYFGRTTNMKLDNTIKDINGMGKKIGQSYYILVTTLIALLLNLVVLLFKS